MTSALQTRGLGKKYTIGAAAPDQYRTLRDAISRGFRGSSRTAAENTFWAVRDIDIDIAQGERIGIIGRNGAGKSTLLKLISRITHPTTGEIRLNGRVSSLLEVGTGFHPELTGRENIFLNGAILGMSRSEIKRNFDAIVDFAGVETFLDTPVKRYSSGMYTRLAFAVAAHLQSDILIVDEVLAVGDAEFQKKCLGKMEEISQSAGKTLLFVSHNMNAVQSLCNKVVHLKGGRIADFSTDVRGVTLDYLQITTGTLSTQWERGADDAALDDPHCRPERMYLGDENGRPLTDALLPGDQDVYVYLDFSVRKLDPAFCAGYAIYDEEGRQLYVSLQTDMPETDWLPIVQGRNVLRSKLPKRFFNEGKYIIEFLASLHYKYYILEPHKTAPSIRFQIQGGLSDSPLWMVRRPGVLAPVLSWKQHA